LERAKGFEPSTPTLARLRAVGEFQFREERGALTQPKVRYDSTQPADAFLFLQPYFDAYINRGNVVEKILT
jgi:hypothetical protein